MYIAGGGCDGAPVTTPPPPPPVPKPTLSMSNNPATILDAYGGATVLTYRDSLIPLAAPVKHYSDSVTALRLRYVQSTANDCSGTFIRLNQ